MKHLLICLLALMLAGCSTAQSRTKLPYDNWYIGIAAPQYMEVWVESVDVVDQRLLAFENVHGGVVGYSSKTAGWSGDGGTIKPMYHVDLPEIIFVRWQSLVEPQTYNARIDIPRWVREEMVKPQRAYCVGRKKWDTDYRKIVVVSMAPGGIVKAWLEGGCLDNRGIGRFQAVINKVGPYNGKSGGKYRPLSPQAKEYTDKHDIPYGSW